MWLKNISILNYKNLQQADLSFSPKLNCILGKNGVGKTNLIDAVYYLSFCKSATNVIDSQNIKHGEEFFVIQGLYQTQEGETEEFYCGLKKRQKKIFKRNKKEYTRLSDHIGLIPLVIISPNDAILIAGGSEERRKFMDLVISQYDKAYLEALISYNKAMTQRNAMLKSETEPDKDIMALWDETMAHQGHIIHEKRKTFIKEFIPIFQSYYTYIAGDGERVSLTYESHLADSDLSSLLKESYPRDRIMGFSLKGIHKDDLNMELGEYPIKREGSQGQNKTFLTALKLAQFAFLKRMGSTPIVLLDDIFDKLDASRVKQIVALVSGSEFGQIFITDTNRTHLDAILQDLPEECYKLFEVMDGQVNQVLNK
ncbi:DNA replication/repair protein RecF [Bacteroides heparinolyticus]|uniref:DNA replication/repair protein RecF n=2 Tax=Prevotella heparinolytica TaxID=28113 RepID=UPI0035A0017A